MRRLWLRADAGPGVGMGHVLRLAALAEVAPAYAAQPCFVLGDEPSAHTVVTRRGFPWVTTAEWQRLVRRQDAIVVDGYRFDDAYIDDCARRCSRSALIDEHRGGRPPVDIVVNPTTTPRHQGAARRLQGPDFALVRAEFRRFRRHRAGGDRVVVTFGGADHGAWSAHFAELAGRTGRWQVTMLLGPAAPVVQAGPAVRTVRDPQDVAAVLSAADVVVSAAGGTVWELLCMGLPTVVVPTVDNQWPVARTVEESHAGRVLWTAGDEQSFSGHLAALADRQVAACLSGRALAAVDGRGAARVAAAVLAGGRAPLAVDRR